MNVLTQIKNQRAASLAEAKAGVPDTASWHARFSHSAYIFVGGLPPSLTEGDLLAVFAQYGEVVDVHLVKDKDTGTSRGFAFLAYEDQRSTVVAVDNLSGTRVGGRTLRVEHVDDYRIKLAELDPGSASVAPPPPPAQTEADAAAAAAAAAGAAAVPEAEASARGDGAPGAPGGPGDAPWADSGSVFALLRSMEAVPVAAGRQAAADDADREARRQRRKEEKRERRRKRSRSPRRRE